MGCTFLRYALLSAAAALLSRGCLLLAAGHNAGDFGVYGVALVEKLTRTS
jgi:hypothetical protein